MNKVASDENVIKNGKKLGEYDIVSATEILVECLKGAINSADMPEPVKSKLLLNIEENYYGGIGFVGLSVPVPSIYEEIGVPYESGNLADIYNTGTSFTKPGCFYGTDETGRRFDMKLSAIPQMTHAATNYAQLALEQARENCAECGYKVFIGLM